MELILLKDVTNLGDKHEVVTVKDGYGRNYLIPQGIAIVANSMNRRKLAELKRREEAIETKRLDEYKAVVDKIGGQVLRIAAKAGTSGKIFGSVTNVQLAQALKDQLDVDVDRHKIHLIEDVKMLGTYTADLKLHKEVVTQLAFEVVQD
ncbi:MAG: 50S ribosomal protein L9 [Saprospiraceae bacterium]|nr:50S ribosomal protein L9 [Saprospiraceae bacterium]MCB9317997.1 50S ribosomal protein L9 [Lewinellaceae bacterium]